MNYIAVVEDDVEIRESMKDALETEGYSVMTFSNGKDALDNLKSKPLPCLILLDLMMPVMDGWQFLDQKKSRTDSFSTVPVIIVSAVSDPQKVKTAGASGYIRKPLDLDVLFKIIKDYCPDGNV